MLIFVFNSDYKKAFYVNNKLKDFIFTMSDGCDAMEIDTDDEKKKVPRGTKKKQYINKRLRNEVWSSYMGSVFSGFCYCCNRKSIDVFSYHCGHVLSEHHGGKTTIQNLRPICSSCNTSGSVVHMKTALSIDVVLSWLDFA